MEVTIRELDLKKRPAAVVCGTFHRDLDGLKRDYDELLAIGTLVLSPVDLDFTGEREGFVYAAHEAHRSPEEIETDHLAAIASADFIWLHAPEGYVGLSASMELGVAHALGRPIFGRGRPQDVTLREFVEAVDSPEQAVKLVQESLTTTPTLGIAALQRYYATVAVRRGYASESIQDCMLLLTEEVGELARAVRKQVGLIRDSSAPVHEAAVELADLQLYLVHLANVMGVDLGQAVLAKEETNARRWEERVRAQPA